MIAVCIPAYNEEISIGSVILLAKKYCDQVILCDDGSTDRTASIAEELGAIVIRHKHNMGKGVALMSLFKYALKNGFDYIVTMDADGQHDPKYIPMLLKPIKEGKADVVIGSRFVGYTKSDTPLYRRFGLWVINLFHGREIKDTQCGFRAYSKKVIPYLLNASSKGYGIDSELLEIVRRRNFKIMEVPVKVRYKDIKKPSKKSPVSQGRDIIGTLISLVVVRHPLVFLGIPGLIFSVIGLTLASFLVFIINTSGVFSVPIALLAMCSLITGIILINAGFTLYSMNRMLSMIIKLHKEE